MFVVSYCLKPWLTYKSRRPLDQNRSRSRRVRVWESSPGRVGSGLGISTAGRVGSGSGLKSDPCPTPVSGTKS